MNDPRKCRCGRWKEDEQAQFCNECECNNVLAYENLRRSGRSHADAVRILWGDAEGARNARA